jgi:hypothetical protein
VPTDTTAISQSDLYKTIIVNKTNDTLEWIEQEVSAGINGSWVDAYDGN